MYDLVPVEEWGLPEAYYGNFHVRFLQVKQHNCSYSFMYETFKLSVTNECLKHVSILNISLHYISDMAIDHRNITNAYDNTTNRQIIH